VGLFARELFSYKIRVSCYEFAVTSLQLVATSSS
jgi:hypothetical protein